MKHRPAGYETINSLQPVIPQRTIIDGRPYMSFKDILWNLILNNLRGMDYDTINKKVDTIVKKPMSAKHRRRLEKQIKKASNFKKS